MHIYGVRLMQWYLINATRATQSKVALIKMPVTKADWTPRARFAPARCIDGLAICSPMGSFKCV